jgi:hypothetical protein
VVHAPSNAEVRHGIREGTVSWHSPRPHDANAKAQL